MGRGQQALLALLDALTKTVLTCIRNPLLMLGLRRWHERESDTTV